MFFCEQIPVNYECGILLDLADQVAVMLSRHITIAPNMHLISKLLYPASVGVISSVCLLVCPSVCLFVCLSDGHDISKAIAPINTTFVCYGSPHLKRFWSRSVDFL